MTKQQQTYVEAREKFSDSLTYFFPNELNDSFDLTVNYPNATYAENLAGIFVTQKLSDRDFDTKRKQFENKARQIISPLDSCNLIVGRFGRIDQVDKYERNIDSLLHNCKNFNLPIPRYCSASDTLILTKDIKGSRFYVISAKQGKYLGQEYLTEGKGLPNEWKNGYSNGILANFNKKEITYWGIVW